MVTINYIWAGIRAPPPHTHTLLLIPFKHTLKILIVCGDVKTVIDAATGVGYLELGLRMGTLSGHVYVAHYVVDSWNNRVWSHQVLRALGSSVKIDPYWRECQDHWQPFEMKGK